VKAHFYKNLNLSEPPNIGSSASFISHPRENRKRQKRGRSCLGSADRMKLDFGRCNPPEAFSACFFGQAGIMMPGVAFLSSQDGFALTVMLVGLILASLARGFSGFGFSAILVTSWSIVTEPARAIALALVLEVTASIFQAFSVWKDIPWRRVMFLLGGAAIGTPFGVALLAYVPLPTMRIAIAVFVILATAALLQGWKLKKKANDAGAGGVGVLSGLANGSTGMGGLPVALFLTADGDNPARIRAAVVAYFFFLDIIGLYFLTRSGLTDMDTVGLAALSLPILLIGMVLGTRHFIAATPEQFRRVTLIMLASLAVIGLARGLLTVV
jgi:uncharacterized membrane protein YfcA